MKGIAQYVFEKKPNHQISRKKKGRVRVQVVVSVLIHVCLPVLSEMGTDTVGCGGRVGELHGKCISSS